MWFFKRKKQAKVIIGSTDATTYTLPKHLTQKRDSKGRFVKT